MNEIISKAIGAHSKWVFHLEQAIKMGASEFDPNVVKTDNHCEFGKWLYHDAPSEIKLKPIYKEIKDLHARFHLEAGRVLTLAISGKKEDAIEGIAIISKFKQLSSSLVLKLASLKEK